MYVGAAVAAPLVAVVLTFGMHTSCAWTAKVLANAFHDGASNESDDVLGARIDSHIVMARLLAPVVVVRVNPM